MHKIWEYAGYNRHTDVKLTIRGKSIKGDSLVEYNPIYNEIVVDSFKLKKDNFHNIIDIIQKYKIKYIHGYPSLLKELMDYCKYFKLHFQLKGIFLGSEGSSVDEKSVLQNFFQCQVVSWYGQTEKITLAIDHSSNGVYRVFTSYGLPGIHNPDEHGFGEITGTTFINKALPIIKYRTGDYGNLIKNKHVYLTNIQGRWGKDFIFLNHDKKIPTTSINLHSPIQNEILFYQI